MDTPPTGRFGALVRSLRLERGLTQEELAEASGVSVRAVGELERGRSVPHRDTVQRLSAALSADDDARHRLTDLARLSWASQRTRAPARSSESRAAATSAQPATQPPRGPARRGPAQLPRDLSDFVGRDEQLALMVESATAEPGGIWIVDGPGGVGKTALAVRFAHRVADRYPDGQLCLDLRGFDPDQPPVTPPAALAHFLRGLGADTRALPTDAETLAAEFRSALSDRRVLLLLDNAASSEQVRTLLPGAADSLVVVTSRHRLSGLAVRHGARRVTLGGLDPPSAIDLLGAILGADPTRERGPLAEAARLCGHLPLALRIAAERARSGAVELTGLVAELADERARLDALATDEENISVRAAFSWSYRGLTPEVARGFRLLGVHPGRDFTVRDAAALIGADAAASRTVLEKLADVHLVERTDGDRFRFHDLMRAYAAERAGADEPAADRDEAARRLLRAQLAAAIQADRQISPQRYRPGLDEAHASHDADHVPTLRNYRQAVDWCDAELDNLVSGVRLAASLGEHALAWRLSWALVGYLDLRRAWDAWLTSHRIGLDCARQAGDRRGEAALLTSLGLAYYYPRLFGEAEECNRRAERLWRELGDRRGEAAILNAMANISLETRAFDQALDRYRAALEINRALGDRRGEGVVLSNMSGVYCELGRYEQVVECATVALAVNRETGNQRAGAFSLCQLARAKAARHGIAEAEQWFRQAFEAAREADDRHVEAWTLDYHGTALQQAGLPEQAAASWRRALALFESFNDPQAISLRARLTDLLGP